DGEVDLLGEREGVGDPVGEHALCADVLEVARASMEEERQLPRVDRDLREARGQRREPERQTTAAPPQRAGPGVQDVRAPVGAEGRWERTGKRVMSAMDSCSVRRQTSA